LTGEKWLHSVHASIYGTAFKDSEDAEWNAFDRMISEHVKSGRLEIRFWRGKNKKDSYFSIWCTNCKYFVHSRWAKKTDDAMLRLLLLSWFYHEVPSFSLKASEKFQNKIPRGFFWKKTAFDARHKEKRTSKTGSLLTIATNRTVAVSSEIDDTASLSPLPEMPFSLWASDFPDFQGPREDLPALGELNREGI